MTFVARYFPIASHANALNSALAVEAAACMVVWVVTVALFW